jgi:hypothetical protein
LCPPYWLVATVIVIEVATVASDKPNWEMVLLRHRCMIAFFLLLLLLTAMIDQCIDLRFAWVGLFVGSEEESMA